MLKVIGNVGKSVILESLMTTNRAEGVVYYDDALMVENTFYVSSEKYTIEQLCDFIQHISSDKDMLIVYTNLPEYNTQMIIDTLNTMESNHLFRYTVLMCKGN